jgi:hypothetical protein
VADRIPAPKRTKTLPIEWAARGLLAALAIAALILAAAEDHEAVGTALVGAAIAFGLGAAFFDRIIEVSTKGVKLADIRALKEAAAREAPDASPDEKEDLVADASEILANRRRVGEPVTPDLALREASLSWRRNGLAAEIHFANWLAAHGWKVIHPDLVAAHTPARQPDLVAEKEGRRIVAEIKVLSRPAGADVVHQILALTPPIGAGAPARAEGKTGYVLLLGETRLTKAATELAIQNEISVYLLDAANEITHLIGPTLD